MLSSQLLNRSDALGGSLRQPVSKILFDFGEITQVRFPHNLLDHGRPCSTFGHLSEEFLRLET
jgi:hypothetical protein